MDQTYGKNFDANLGKGAKNATKGIKENLSSGNMKNMVNEGFENLGDTFEKFSFDWKTVLSGVAVLGAIGAYMLSRGGRGTLKGKIGKKVGGYISGHKASGSHPQIRSQSGGRSRSSSSRRSSSRASSAH